MVGLMLVGSACSDTAEPETAGVTEPPLATTTTPPSTVPVVAETTTTAAPTTATDADEPEYDEEEDMAALRDELVDLLIQRGAEPGDAEVEADRLMAGDFDGERATTVLTLEIAIYEDWMANYQLHPVMGSLWTEEEASCAILEMLKQNGVAGTDRLLTIADTSGLNKEDAFALVQPVADCTDLRAMTLEAMTIGGADSPECLLRPVTEEQIVLWHVLDFMAGRDAYWYAVDYDLDLTCIGGPA